MKSRDDPKFKQLIAFIDLVFNVMMAFAFLFILAFALMSVQSKNQPTVEMKAELMIIFTWPEWSPDDLDVWLRLPSGQAVWWQNTTGGLANLERDDWGLERDITTTTEGEYVINPLNREVIILRSLIPGTYQVNVHYWLQRQLPPGVPTTQAIPQPPYPVKVEMVRLNPFYTEIVKVDLTLEEQGQEKSAFGFTVTPNGDIVGIDHVFRPFVTEATLESRTR